MVRRFIPKIGGKYFGFDKRSNIYNGQERINKMILLNKILIPLQQ
jgi:hypothetical protein